MGWAKMGSTQYYMVIGLLITFCMQVNNQHTTGKGEDDYLAGE